MILGKCALCGIENTRIVGHHLSYDPEIIVNLCVKHHSLVHYMAEMTSQQRDIVDAWIQEFSYQWVDGARKYRNSQARKNLMKLARGKDYYASYNHNPENVARLKEAQKRYREKHKDEIRYKYHQWYHDPKNEAKIRAKERNRRSQLRRIEQLSV